jgi:hypothetical protein
MIILINNNNSNREELWEKFSMGGKRESEKVRN